MAEHQLPKLNTGVRFPSPALLLLCVALLVAPILIVPAPAPASTCPDVVVIGVAGSGQAPGTGPQVGKAIDSITASLAAAGLTTDVRPLDYPAVDVAATLGIALLTGWYRDSVAAGVDSLLDSLSNAAASCPTTISVLVGYSQGAQVIKTAAPDIPSATPVAAILLLADPTASPTDDIARFGAASQGDGALGPMTLPGRFDDRTVAVCAIGDVVCGGGRLHLGAHIRGYPASATQAPAMRIAALASVQIRARTTHPVSTGVPIAALLR